MTSCWQKAAAAELIISKLTYNYNFVNEYWILLKEPTYVRPQCPFDFRSASCYTNNINKSINVGTCGIIKNFLTGCKFFKVEYKISRVFISILPWEIDLAITHNEFLMQMIINTTGALVDITVSGISTIHSTHPVHPVHTWSKCKKIIIKSFIIGSSWRFLATQAFRLPPLTGKIYVHVIIFKFIQNDWCEQ